MACCFGTLVNLDYTPIPNKPIYRGRIEVGHRSDTDLIEENSNNLFGYLGTKAQKILTTLQKDLEIHLYAEDYTPGTKTASIVQKTSKRAKNDKTGARIWLSAVLYGPEVLFENVGKFAAKCGFYLQHPIHCALDVPYRNPHCLTIVGGDTSTFQLLRSLDIGSRSQDNNLNPIDLFADFEDHSNLPESSPPPSISRDLYHHQKQALTFMLQREAGWALTSTRKDVWKTEIDQNGEWWYINKITGNQQRREPPSFKGGLLIDAPGLGKSLSILCLIASDIQATRCAEAEPTASTNTLLVVPNSVMHVWKNEIRKHFHPGLAIKQILYYGRGRKLQLQRMSANHLVITTYSMVRLDWKASKQDGVTDPNLFAYKWRRLVLDEAHIIREPSKSLAQSVYELDAEMRWAVTGTPIQNRLTDLFSLFKFLRCHPFDTRESFAVHVTQSWKRSDPTSIGKLKLLINCLSLRRPKDTVELPPIRNKERRLDFSDEEKACFDYLKQRTKAKLASADTSINSVTFVNTLQWINEMRLMCNHGQRSFQETERHLVSWNQAEAQKRFDSLESSGLAACCNPTCNQDLSSAMEGEEDQVHDDEPWISESLILYCHACHQIESDSRNTRIRICNHVPRHGKQSKQEKEASSSVYGSNVEVQVLPSKLQALISDLVKTPLGVKSVVFSAWTRTFEILKPHLISNSIRSVRLDGSLSANERAKVLQRFDENKDITILLATISCGGVGLDLTAASRAYIMEPQWNPMSESQALDRVYRIGQEKEVTTIRYIMRDSFEEQILKLQNKKKELADLTINSRQVSRQELNASRLAWLKDLVG